MLSQTPFGNLLGCLHPLTLVLYGAGFGSATLGQCAWATGWGTCTRLLLVLYGAEVRAKPQSSLLLPSLFIFLGKGAVVAVLELNCKVFSCCRLSWQLVPVYVSPLWSGVWERNAQKHTLLPSFFIFLGKGVVVAVYD